MGKKILLVDDDKDLLYGMKVWLRANGYHVLFAADAMSAITTAQAERPDLILVDIGLPGGDGYLIIHLPELLQDVYKTSGHDGNC